MAPMVHWPEVMVTYDSTDKVLFSADGFGKFGALSHEEEWADEARRYYINICGKYGAPVQALLKKASTLDIAIICPLHGPVLTENLGYYIGLYDTWSKYEPEEEGVFVAEPPHIDALSTIGAGDSTIGGFLAGAVSGQTKEEMLRTAVAYGTAACLTSGTKPPRKEDVDVIVKQVKILKKN